MDSSGFTSVPTAPPSEKDPLNLPPPNAPPPSYNQAVFQSDKTVYQSQGDVYQPQPPMQQGSNVQPITVARLNDQNENVQPVTVSRLPDDHEEISRPMTPIQYIAYMALISVLVFLSYYIWNIF